MRSGVREDEIRGTRGTIVPRTFIPSYHEPLYPRTTDRYTLVPRTFIPSYHGPLYPRTTDLYTLVPRTFIPSYLVPTTRPEREKALRDRGLLEIEGSDSPPKNKHLNIISGYHIGYNTFVPRKLLPGTAIVIMGISGIRSSVNSGIEKYVLKNL